MSETKYIFGTVPSRRLGNSLGISPIPKKTCNFSCVYCQLGRTNKMTNTPKEFFPVKDILAEFDAYHKNDQNFDIVTIVGEGEPTLYSKIDELIVELKKRTDKPVAVITNSALLYDGDVRKRLLQADMVLPSLDFCDEETFRKVDRPFGTLTAKQVYDGLVAFSKEYKGQLALEIMLVKDMNDSDECLLKFKELLKAVRYDSLSINTPVRPPAEDYVEVVTDETLKKAVEWLGGSSIEMLSAGAFSSDITDDYEAILSIIGRHPMNQFEVKSFLTSRGDVDIEDVFAKLKQDGRVEKKIYKGYTTFRLQN